MFIHVWHRCHACDTRPVVGLRYNCGTCPDGPDNDLCEACYATLLSGRLVHPAPSSPYAAVAGEHQWTCYEGQSADQYEPWLHIPMAPGAAPVIDPGLLVRPEFLSGYESTFAGYAFAVRYRDRTLILTALHVMDEMVRKKNLNLRSDGVTGRELPPVIHKVNLYDVLAARWMVTDLGSAGPMLVLPEARLGILEPDSDRDIAAFHASDNPHLKPAELADRVPQPGEAVWLAATCPEKNHLQKAVVVASLEKGLIFRFEDSAEKVKYTSGAPILNQEGQVVALNVGGGWFAGQRLGHGNHTLNIRRHLDAGLGS